MGIAQASCAGKSGKDGHMNSEITPQELNNMAQNKGLVSPTKDLSFNSMYAAFGNVPESRILSPELIGLSDDALIQVRQAVYNVGKGDMTIDEAVASYGSFTS